MGRHLRVFGLSLTVLGALLVGCQQQTGPVPGAAVPSTTDAHQPTSDRPDRTPTADEAPTTGRGVVSGRVREPSGGPVVDATVRVRSLDTPPVPVPELVVTTDEGGCFRWPLAPGRYEVTVLPADGTAPVTAPAVEVQAGAERRIDVTVS